MSILCLHLRCDSFSQILLPVFFRLLLQCQQIKKTSTLRHGIASLSRSPNERGCLQGAVSSNSPESDMSAGVDVPCHSRVCVYQSLTSAWIIADKIARLIHCSSVIMMVLQIISCEECSCYINLLLSPPSLLVTKSLILDWTRTDRQAPNDNGGQAVWDT